MLPADLRARSACRPPRPLRAPAMTNMQREKNLRHGSAQQHLVVPEQTGDAAQDARITCRLGRRPSPPPPCAASPPAPSGGLFPLFPRRITSVFFKIVWLFPPLSSKYKKQLFRNEQVGVFLSNMAKVSAFRSSSNLHRSFFV